MKLRQNKLLRRALAMLCLSCVLVLGLRTFDLGRGQASAEEARNLIQLPDLETLPAVQDVSEDEPAETNPLIAALAGIDISILQEVNPDVSGWISIPNTVISYPLLEARDNQQYLRHTWLGEYSMMGSIYYECKVASDLSAFNTIVYGHRMSDLSMFGTLKYYVDKTYWEQHPSVYLVNADGVHRYDIYAAYEGSVRSLAYAIEVTDPAVKEQIIRQGLEKSVYDTGITPTAEDQILTLSTCPQRGTSTRWIVQAVRGPSYPLQITET